MFMGQKYTIFKDYLTFDLQNLYLPLNRIKMNKIEHIGIAVKNIESSNLLFAKLFGETHYKTEAVISEGVKTSFFKVGPNKIELLEDKNPESPIAKFIEK